IVCRSENRVATSSRANSQLASRIIRSLTLGRRGSSRWSARQRRACDQRLARTKRVAQELGPLAVGQACTNRHGREAPAVVFPNLAPLRATGRACIGLARNVGCLTDRFQYFGRRIKRQGAV